MTGTVRIHEEFLILDKARAFVRETLKKFKPETYGTYLKVRRARDHHGWEVSGHRFA